MRYARRIVDDELDGLLAELPAVALEGPRGVGKTATAEQRARTTFYLDDPAQRAILDADPRLILTAAAPVLIDEWQRVPAVWDAVRRAVDRGSDPARFILTGSASPVSAPSHSGAGRIVTLSGPTGWIHPPHYRCRFRRTGSCCPHACRARAVARGLCGGHGHDDILGNDP